MTLASLPEVAAGLRRSRQVPFTRYGMGVAITQLVEDRTLSKISEARGKAMVRAVTGVPWPRVGNLALGVWLQCSAVAWPHADDSRLSAWLPGLLISIVALLAMSAPPMRWLNAFLALWLLLWTFAATGTEPYSYLNGVVCSLLVFLLSAIPSRSAASDWRD